jgi:hypothetical protein
MWWWRGGLGWWMRGFEKFNQVGFVWFGDLCGLGICVVCRGFLPCWLAGLVVSTTWNLEPTKLIRCSFNYLKSLPFKHLTTYFSCPTSCR